MRSGKMMVVTLAVGLAMLASGCASGGTVRVSSAKRCAAHGGTYNTSAKTCAYAATTKTAQQSCEAESGYYNSADDFCSFNP